SSPLTLFYILLLPPPLSTPFPYTTLFRSPRGIPRLKAMLENWLGYVERIVFRGGCFFAAASAEFDSRPGAVRDQIAELTKAWMVDRKSTRLNSSHVSISYAVFCLKKKKSS